MRLSENCLVMIFGLSNGSLLLLFHCWLTLLPTFYPFRIFPLHTAHRSVIGWQGYLFSVDIAGRHK